VHGTKNLAQGSSPLGLKYPENVRTTGSVIVLINRLLDDSVFSVNSGMRNLKSLKSVANPPRPSKLRSLGTDHPRFFMNCFFFFFFTSGFCSVLYEVVWLRLAMAQFGVTSALVSMVLSAFMAGLAVGSQVSGRLIKTQKAPFRIAPLRLYAASELLVGASSISVPLQLAWGHSLLQRIPLVSSASYYLVSGTWVFLTIVPWCTFMGATIPIAMAAIRQAVPPESESSFSFLYQANVMGAVFGALIPLFLIELFGFTTTLKISGILNLSLALSAILVSLHQTTNHDLKPAPDTPISLKEKATPSSRSPTLLLLLFTTGITSMGIEVVWIRQFTPYLGTVVYSFALILAIYLTFTAMGSRLYRRRIHREIQDWRIPWPLLSPLALLSLVSTSPGWTIPWPVRLLLGIGPFSAALGFVTPMLVDHYSGGDSERAGKAYAINILGCIVGPLFSGFLLLPAIGERWALFALSFAFLVAGIPFSAWPRGDFPIQRTWSRYAGAPVILVALLLVFTIKGYEEQFSERVVLRDNTATVIATGSGRDKRLLVNGIGITSLTPITKIMAHLPLAFLDHPPQNALAVCLGMGTTYRSLLAWGIPTTAVELVPSVPHLLWYYHADAPELLQSPLSTVIVDDGRRYLERTSEQFDVITVDPPPPIESAGSSLLYSKEFYSIVGRKLRPGGILQQWLPGGDVVTQASAARALKESFRYVRSFRSIEGWGFHVLASDHPLPDFTATDLVQRMPARAVQDLVEWSPNHPPEHQFTIMLQNEIPIDALIQQAPQSSPIQDDRPANEYFALRTFFVRLDRDSTGRLTK